MISEKLDRVKPVLLIGMNPSIPTDGKAKYMEGVAHLSFLVKLYENRRTAGRFFLHEHARASQKTPEKCASWLEWNMRELQGMTDVLTFEAELCAFGATVADAAGSLPLHAKPVRWVTNSQVLKQSLSLRCSN